MNPLLNDAPGHPDVPLVPESLTLLDAEGNEVETVTVPEGVYTIDRSDPDAPLIVFTPNRGFTGIPTAVEYRVLDANGTPAEAEYQPFVRGPVGDEDLAQTLVCTTPMVFDLAADVDGLDPRSVTLVDGAGEHVTEIVVDGEGTWRLDPETGVVTFTPAGCFLGDLTPVNWEGWLLDGTPVSGVLSGTYVEEIAETGGDATPLIALGALSALLFAAGSALLIRRRRVLA
ncbi:LPXTG cell wall anchor domain-containing protein [Microbacterium sp. NIBRBAC000506063]|uniref:LPXTG cell wall anchor domain-containing protein n=1 Tax=Microbacterium sp. NIBRBAC000506063 TaxID=2734618 RepID=UPI001BB604F3|nr:LPXTG cell wall anchor domain-containing protein [Microbacterium sp. NIBRBAC000506063]QTV79881.1 LPXTG cell wall anchor domain-containing protein [Microbacterium sp. NIBRBAC000506063]